MREASGKKRVRHTDNRFTQNRFALHRRNWGLWRLWHIRDSWGWGCLSSWRCLGRRQDVFSWHSWGLILGLWRCGWGGRGVDDWEGSGGCYGAGCWGIGWLRLGGLSAGGGWDFGCCCVVVSAFFSV